MYLIHKNTHKSSMYLNTVQVLTQKINQLRLCRPNEPHQHDPMHRSPNNPDRPRFFATWVCVRISKWAIVTMTVQYYQSLLVLWKLQEEKWLPLFLIVKHLTQHPQCSEIPPPPPLSLFFPSHWPAALSEPFKQSITWLSLTHCEKHTHTHRRTQTHTRTRIIWICPAG